MEEPQNKKLTWNSLFSHNKSLVKLPSTEKINSTFITDLKPSNIRVLKENKKLKQIIAVLRSNLQATEELLNRQFKDLANHNEISLLKSKVRTLEQKLIESETQTSSLQSKLQNLQKDLKSVIKERDVLTDGKEEKEANAEKYRTMKIKALKVLIKFFSVETPKVLHLRYLEIDNSFIPIIGNMLKRHPSIESLDLEGNFLTDEGAKLISEIISYSDSNISDINLSYNKISTEGAWLIVQAMKIRDETKFKKVKSVNLIHNLIEKPADIFLKAWDYFKPIRDFFPQNNLKAAELRRVSNSTATKIFSTAVGNIKEVQDLIEVIERIKVVDVQEGKRQLRAKGSFQAISESFLEVSEEKVLKNKPLQRKSIGGFEVKEIYNANGELVPSLVEGLLKSSMDIDSIDRAADENLLMHAAKIGNLRFVKLLISKNAKINVKNSLGENAFLVACKHGQFEIAEFLILAGARLTSADKKGALAIHMAVKLLKKDSLCRLVELGININSVDLHKKTPLHYAARMGNIEIGNLLVKLGAELNLLDYKGRTPAGLAENKEHFHFSDVLEKLGGKKINSYVTVNLQTVENTEISSLSEMNNELFKDMKVADRKYKHFYKQ